MDTLIMLAASLGLLVVVLGLIFVAMVIKVVSRW